MPSNFHGVRTRSRLNPNSAIDAQPQPAIPSKLIPV